MDHSNIGSRMKKYEYVTRTHLIPRTPVIIRVDGRAFHTFTRGFEKPFDALFISAMHQTMKFMCENIQGCVIGYTQSDEISLVLIDYKKLDSASWFDYNIQKCTSIASSMATLAFNKAFEHEIVTHHVFQKIQSDIHNRRSPERYLNTLIEAMNNGAMFDARVFNIPREEVCNYLLWRQLDATRNSIQMVAQAYFSHRELQNKSCSEIQEMLFSSKGINWTSLPTHLKRGSCCVKQDDIGHPGRTGWHIDLDIPTFTGDDRGYVDKWVELPE